MAFSSDKLPSMDYDMLEFLIKFYEEDLKRLEELLNKPQKMSKDIHDRLQTLEPLVKGVLLWIGLSVDDKTYKDENWVKQKDFLSRLTNLLIVAKSINIKLSAETQRSFLDVQSRLGMSLVESCSSVVLAKKLGKQAVDNYTAARKLGLHAPVGKLSDLTDVSVDLDCKPV